MPIKRTSVENPKQTDKPTNKQTNAQTYKPTNKQINAQIKQITLPSSSFYYALTLAGRGI